MQTAKFLSLFSGGELIPTHSFLPHPLPSLPLLLSPASRRPVGLPAGQRTLNLKAAWRVHSLSPHIPSYFSHIQPHDFNLNHLTRITHIFWVLAKVLSQSQIILRPEGMKEGDAQVKRCYWISAAFFLLLLSSHPSSDVRPPRCAISRTLAWSVSLPPSLPLASMSSSSSPTPAGHLLFLGLPFPPSPPFFFSR